MQPGSLNRDSIGYCDLYSNPYDARLQGHPALVRKRQILYIRAQDSLASRQLRMEKEIFSRILKGHLLFPHLPAINQVSKFLFLAFILPPYMVCYGIPKWVFAALLPKFYHFSQNILQRISNQLTRVVSRTLYSLYQKGGKITIPIQSLIKTHITKIAKFFNKRKRMSIITTFFKQIPFSQVQKAVSQVINIFRNVKTLVMTYRQKTRYFFIYFPNNTARKFFEISEKLQKKLSESLPTLTKPFLPAIRWVREKRETVSRSISNAIENTIYPLVLRGIYQPMQKAIHFAKSVHVAAKKAVTAFFTPVFKWAEPRLTEFKEKVVKRWEALVKFVDHRKQRIQERLKQVIHNVSQLTSSMLRKVKNSTVLQFHRQLISHPAFSLFSSQVSKILTYRFNYRKTKEVMQSSAQMIQKKMHSGSKRAFKQLKQAFSNVLKITKKGCSYLLTFPAYAYHLFKKLLQVILVVCKASFLIIRLMLAWIKVLFRYGMILAREKTKKLLHSSLP